MVRHKRGKTVRKNRNRAVNEEEDFKSQPHTIVFSRGQVGQFVKRLAVDLRSAFEPYTALRFRFRRSNVLKDVVAIAGQFHVTHLVYLTHPEDAVNLRIVRTAHGPTLTFRVMGYTLQRDVLSSLRKFNMAPAQFRSPPLLIMSGFTGDGMHLPLMTATFRAMFPAINVSNVKLSNVKRCVLLQHDPDTGVLIFRHYSIRLVPRGMSKAVRRMRRKKVPNLGKYRDMADFVTGAGQQSDSGLSDGDEDGAHNEVELQADMGRGNKAGGRSSVRLTEIGPRLSLQLVKVEEGVNDGEVLYHRFQELAPEQKAELEERHRKKSKLKERRRREQALRVQKKAAEREKHKEKCLSGMRSKGQLAEEDEVEEDDDEEEYRREVGSAPEPGLFPKRKRKQPTEFSSQSAKKPRVTAPATIADQLLKRKKNRAKRLKMKKKGKKKK